MKSLAIKYIAKLGYLPEDVSILAGEITVPEFLRQAEKELKAEVKE
nr:MAG TPA: LcrG protein [Caudoviricetes sp.]